MGECVIWTPKVYHQYSFVIAVLQPTIGSWNPAVKFHVVYLNEEKENASALSLAIYFFFFLSGMLPTTLVKQQTRILKQRPAVTAALCISISALCILPSSGFLQTKLSVSWVKQSQGGKHSQYKSARDAARRREAPDRRRLHAWWQMAETNVENQARGDSVSLATPLLSPIGNLDEEFQRARDQCRERASALPQVRRTASPEPAMQKTNTGPTTLIVLAHGLSGTRTDLSFLKQAIEDLENKKDNRYLVLLASSNEGKTTDGVANGAQRLAYEILETVERTPSLTHISLLGNSLGGLYSRYAAALLYMQPLAGDDGQARICGLIPRDFVTTASPHLGTQFPRFTRTSVQILTQKALLGTRRFTYVPIPDVLHVAAPLVIGRY